MQNNLISLLDYLTTSVSYFKKIFLVSWVEILFLDNETYDAYNELYTGNFSKSRKTEYQVLHLPRKEILKNIRFQMLTMDITIYSRHFEIHFGHDRSFKERLLQALFRASYLSFYTTKHHAE